MNILITGAANGIGAAIAKQAAEAGHTIGLYDIDEANVNLLANNINSTASKTVATSGKMDVSSEQDWDNALAHFTDFAGHIDVLVNNAGILSSGKFNDISLQEHLAEIEVNAKGVLLGCYKTKPLLKKHSNAKIINIISASSLHGQPDIASYAATKAYVRNITEGLDIEWADDGIRVFDIMPLYVRTNMIKGIKTHTVHSMGVDHTPDDVARVVIQTLSKSNSANAHQIVGLKTKLMYIGFKLLPDYLRRKMHLRMVKRE